MDASAAARSGVRANTYQLMMPQTESPIIDNRRDQLKSYVLSIRPVYSHSVSLRRFMAASRAPVEVKIGYLAAASYFLIGLVFHLTVVEISQIQWSLTFLFLITLILFSGTFALNDVRGKTLKLTLQLLENSDCEDAFCTSLRRVFRCMYGRFWTALFAFAVLLPTCILLYRILAPAKLTTFTLVYFLASAAISGLMAGLGLWCALSSLYFLSVMSRADAIKYYPPAPNRSRDVLALSNLLVRYSVLFALEVTLFIMGYLIFSQSTLPAQFGVRVHDLRRASAFMLIFLLFMVLYFRSFRLECGYPQQVVVDPYVMV